jgi:hypothetical protein
MMSLQKMAELLGGDVNGDGVLCPGPGHSDADRSLSVKLDENESEGFVVNSFSGDDWRECRAHVRKKLGLPKRPERKKERKSGGDGKWQTLAEYIYRDKDGKPYLMVRKCIDPKGKRQFPQFHWDGNDWITGKPEGPKIPHMLPQLLAASLTATVYFVEGEKDADNLAKLGFVATTASEGAKAKWDPALTPYFKDRHVVILPDADDTGRKHGQKVAKAINGAAASVRILDLYPDRDDGLDVSDWIADDPAGAKLAKLAKEAPLWEPMADDDDDQPSGDDAEITRLAKLKPLEYDRERKAAGETLGVRTSILDRLVRDERARLGLDGGGDELQGQAISFEEIEPWPTEVNGAQLLDEVATAIRSYVVMSDYERDICALWIVHSYLIGHFMISPKLSVRSTVRNCGKTTLLDVLSHLVFRAWVTGSITKAALFRVIDKWHPTLLIDEVDSFVGDDEELRGILNHSHRYDGTVTRTVGDDHEPRKFSVYAAVALSGIGGLAATLADRSVTAALKRRRPSETITQLRLGRMGHLHALRRRIVRWVADYEERIGECDPEMPNGLYNREADNWTVLLAVADEAGGKWPERARKAAEAAHVAAADDDASRLEQLLADIRKVSTGKDEMPSGALVGALVGLDGRPWADLGKGRKLTTNRLASMLRPLSLTTENIRIGDKVLKGYVFKHFMEAFERYLPPEGASEPLQRYNAVESGTSATFQTATPDPDVAVGKCQKSASDGHSSVVAVARGGKDETRAASASNGGPPAGMSERRIREHADWYTESAYRNTQETGGDTRAAELDAELRRHLAADGVLPEYIETELKRVMAAVFGA